jgi:hypothetical protein
VYSHNGCSGITTTIPAAAMETQQDRQCTHKVTVLQWKKKKIIFTYIPCILILSKFSHSPTDAQVNFLKNSFKIYIKIDIETHLTCFQCKHHHQGALPDDCVCTEKYRRCINVNFNVNFKLFLRQFTCTSVGE